MGNYASCVYMEPQTAILIDAHGNLRRIKLPISAAEIMLDEPGHVVSPAQQIQQTRRISPIKADDELSVGKAYLLVPASRMNCKVSGSEMALIESATANKRFKRHSSGQVSPAATEESGGQVEKPHPVLQGNITGLACHPVANPCGQWKPVLETIFENEPCATCHVDIWKNYM
ncbi:hypothetical protein U1Q18_019954 [Sarracenia purpurea var. burkii]